MNNLRRTAPERLSFYFCFIFLSNIIFSEEQMFGPYIKVESLMIWCGGVLARRMRSRKKKGLGDKPRREAFQNETSRNQTGVW